METTAYAKLNLSLDILRRRDDGYHDLQMVMVSIDLTDTLTLTPGEGAMSTNLSFLPADGNNLAQKAASAFRTATGQGEALDIHIDKHIPVCAGMAGGSSDAAAVLRAMNERYHTGLSPALFTDADGRARLPCGGVQAPLPHLHPPAVWPGEREEDHPPPRQPGYGGGTGARGSAGGGPAAVQRL